MAFKTGHARVIPGRKEMPLVIDGDEKHWHYPTNLPVRDYQLAIAETCLKFNTLVILPTGLGKTLIASVVLFNFRRWFPGGKLVFMAPTRPLVAQQLSATQQLCGCDELVELTGAQIPSERERLWRAKWMFFTTPHVLQNDLATGSCPGGEIRLLVFDEAHKATGRYAYCEVMRHLHNNMSMRVVGLTATPAATVGGIQQLVDVLRIAKVEYRSEESPDVAPYSHRRDVRQIVVQPSADLVRVQDCFQHGLMAKYYGELRKHNAIADMPLAELQSFRLLRERDSCRVRLHGNPVLGMLEGCFGMLMSLAVAGEILALHGIVPFVNQLQNGEEGPLRTRLRNELESNPMLLRMIKEMSNDPGFVSHPKITLVETLLLEHFQDSALDTRAIVFAQYRESVREIVARLARHAPRIKAMAFMGQTAATLSSKAFTQKQQLEVLKSFREGGYNVLVSTSIGEEGLDIGSVDLIVCYDMQSSPVRHLQRIGRTGRQRTGSIVLLTSAGREEQRYEQMRAGERSFTAAIQNPARHFRLANEAPLDIGQCIRRAFVMPMVVDQTRPRKSRTKAGQNNAAVACFDAFSMEMLEACPKPNAMAVQSLGASFRIGHSSRCENYVKLLRLFKSADDSGASSASPAAVAPPEAPSTTSLEELMSKWADPRIGFDAVDLEAFFRLTLPLIKTTTKKSMDAMTSEPPQQQQQLVVEIPDDFFVDFDEIELLTIDAELEFGGVKPLDPLDMTKAESLPKSHSSRTVTPAPLANDRAPQVLSPLKPMTSSSTATPIVSKIDPAPQIHQPMAPKSPLKSLSSSRTETPIAVRVRPVFVSQTPNGGPSPIIQKRKLNGNAKPLSSFSSNLASPVVKKPKGSASVARHFVESQAVDDESCDDEEDEEGYSELGSFIDDGTQEEEATTFSDGSETASSSPPDMMAFYRQSLLHSQPFGGFATGSRYVHKPPVRKPSALCSIITEDEDEEEEEEEEEEESAETEGNNAHHEAHEDALAGIVEWDSADDFAL